MKALQINVSLSGIRPPVWRRLLVPSEYTLARLHRVLQVAMGWHDCHLHRFVLDGTAYSDPQFELDNVLDERKITVGDLLVAPGVPLIYEYDLGDDWKHELILEETAESEEVRPPMCVGGARACPPEDCGGPFGYDDLLRILKSPKHRRYREMREWVGSDFDPEAFDCDEVNKRLAKTFRQKR